MSIDWEKLQKLHPEEWEEAHETHGFAHSPYGKKRREQLEGIIEDTKDLMVAAINSGLPTSIEDAKASAALIDGIKQAIGVLYENDLITAEGLLASEEIYNV